MITTMTKEFCTRCVEKEATFEVMFNKMYAEVEELKRRVNELESENEKLSLDLAFYNGSITNLSCNGK